MGRSRNGQPIAFVIGVEGADWETVAVASSRSFWKEIAQRRNQNTTSLVQIRKRLGAYPAKPARSKEKSAPEPAQAGFGGWVKPALPPRSSQQRSSPQREQRAGDGQHHE